MAHEEQKPDQLATPKIPIEKIVRTCTGCDKVLPSLLDDCTCDAPVAITILP